MSFTPSVAVTQSALTPSDITLVDDSSGSDGSISVRRVYIQTATGAYLVEEGTTTDYEVWSYSTSTITLDVLTQDECVNIVVQWLNSSNVVLYTYENQYALAEYNKQFLVYLVQAQGLTPGIVQDSNYSGNVGIFWTNIIAGVNQVEFGAEIAGGQNCFNRATYMRLNQADFF
jgi:hypothetical protein